MPASLPSTTHVLLLINLPVLASKSSPTPHRHRRTLEHTDPKDATTYCPCTSTAIARRVHRRPSVVIALGVGTRPAVKVKVKAKAQRVAADAV